MVSAPRSELRAVDRVPPLLRTLPRPIVIGAAVSPGHHVVHPRCPLLRLMGFVPSLGKPKEVASIDLEVW